MADSKKPKYLTKSVRFGTKLVTLYSIDGLTWSSKRQELTVIKERLENKGAPIAEIRAAGEEEDSKEKSKDAKDDEPVVLGSDEDDDASSDAKSDADDSDEKDDADVAEDMDQIDDDDDDDAVAVRSSSKSTTGARGKPTPKARPKKPAVKAKAVSSKQRRQAA